MLLKPLDVVVASDDALYLDKVRSIIEKEMGDPAFGAERLALEIGSSRRQLQRRMKALLDISPTELIRDMRLERAKSLLEQRAGNISEIAYKVGYKNAKYFSRLFKERYGYSPSQHKDPETE